LRIDSMTMSSKRICSLEAPMLLKYTDVATV
jgi:hypothetical protein